MLETQYASKWRKHVTRQSEVVSSTTLKPRVSNNESPHMSGPESLDSNRDQRTQVTARSSDPQRRELPTSDDAGIQRPVNLVVFRSPCPVEVAASLEVMPISPARPPVLYTFLTYQLQNPEVK